MKEDEKKFLIDLYLSSIDDNGLITGKKLYPGDIMHLQDFNIPYKRVLYILEKWTDKGWYEYGCSLIYGWLTAKGNDVAKNIISENIT